MCTPSMPKPVSYQASKAPTYREGGSDRSTGRKGTILTGGNGVVEAPAYGAKKSLLGT